MADVDGTWDCVTASPMGEQKTALTVNSAGTTFTGEISGALGTLPVTDGTVDGDTIGWAMEVKMPFPMRLDCKATIAGDSLDGTVTAGAFGSFPMTGTRRA
ncbi:hypothetical protein [Sphingomonas profundi]|uniref:hypothetical protein n=1 Tax=Alterirhizorhabdus profundi TaxID=2681549 RepID=UPI0012E8FDFD|nr:hypothetical protein [Sphingomonas profundi]